MPFYRQINWQSGEVTCLSSHGHLEVNVGAKLEFIHTMSCSGVKYHSSVREEASNVCKQIRCTSQEPEYFGHNLLDVRHFSQAMGSARLMYKDGRKLRAASGIHQISRHEVRMAERQHGQRWGRSVNTCLDYTRFQCGCLQKWNTCHLMLSYCLTVKSFRCLLHSSRNSTCCAWAYFPWRMGSLHLSRLWHKDCNTRFVCVLIFSPEGDLKWYKLSPEPKLISLDWRIWIHQNALLLHIIPAACEYNRF